MIMSGFPGSGRELVPRYYSLVQIHETGIRKMEYFPEKISIFSFGSFSAVSQPIWTSDAALERNFSQVSFSVIKSCFYATGKREKILQYIRDKMGSR